MNNPNRTSTAQVMVHFLGLPQLGCLFVMFGFFTEFGTRLGLILGQFDGQFWLDCVDCFVGISMPQLVLKTKLSLFEFE